jgi:hypothetical protein
MAAVVTNAGRALAVDLLRGASASVPTFVGTGAGGASARVTDTALTAEQGSRMAGSATSTTTATPFDTFEVNAVFIASAPTTFGEAGLFTQAAAGILFFHADFPAVTLQPGDEISISCQVQFQ